MIKDFEKSKKADLIHLMLKLWEGESQSEFEKEVDEQVRKDTGFYFLAYDSDKAIGFAEVSLRQDYVEGTVTSPVGYLEGIYVLPDYRERGIAKQLVQECETWAKQKGCSEFASDCELTNTESEAFHKSIGFEEANRIICFTKKL